MNPRITESESAALPLGDTPVYYFERLNHSALLLYHYKKDMSSIFEIFLLFNLLALYLNLYAKEYIIYIGIIFRNYYELYIYS